MNELSERAKQLADTFIFELVTDDTEAECEWVARVIEQALLAERALARRDAMEEAAKIAMSDILFIHEVGHAEVRNSALQRTIAQALRAAAEKEVK